MLWAVALALPRVETAEWKGGPVVIQVDDARADYAIVQTGPVESGLDWHPHAPWSSGRARWNEVFRVRREATRDLLAADTVAWVERARHSLQGTWIQVASALAGTGAETSEEASQEAARFRANHGRPVGLYGSEALRGRAALDAWLARPADIVVTGSLLEDLERIRNVYTRWFGAGNGFLGHASRDPLVPLSAPLPWPLASPPPLDLGEVSVRPQLTRLPDTPHEPRVPEAFQGSPHLFVPARWTRRGRPVMVGFLGVETLPADIHYTRAPTVTGPEGALDPRLSPQSTHLDRPRYVELTLDRLPTDAEIAERLTQSPDPEMAFADLLPPSPWCGCVNSSIPGWPTRR